MTLTRRTPLARTGHIARTSYRMTRTAMSSKPSAGQRVQNNRRRHAYAVVDARSGGQCEAAIACVVAYESLESVYTVRCPDRAIEHQHRRPRGAGGSRRASTEAASNLIATCRRHHDEAERMRTAALEESGWLVPQSHDPASVPVNLFCGVVYLTDAGTYERTAP